MRRIVLGAVFLSTFGWLVQAAPAHAACHAFEVAVAPADPAEGATVEVTVTRDAGVNPSSVRARTADGTATAGRDYEAVDRRIEFATETSQTFTIRILQDAADEPAETFTIALSEAGGCQVNPDFSYGTPATVSIRDDDEPAPATTAAPPTTAAPTTLAPRATTTTAPRATTTTEGDDATATTTAPGTDETTTTQPETTLSFPATTTDTVTAAAPGAGDDDDGGGAGAWLIAAAVVVLLAIAATVYWLYRNRSSPTV